MRAYTFARPIVAIALGLSLAALQSGCVTVAEHRRLEREVAQVRRTGGTGERVADLRTQLDAIDRRLAKIEGRLDETQHTATRALEEARRARRDASGAPLAAPTDAAAEDPSSTPPSAVDEPTPAPPAAATETVAPEQTAAVAPPAPREPVESGASVQEVSAYRDAHGAYRSGEYDACIDRFRTFLQTYPTSPYADDAAYWMAECHFKKGDYKSAILRFDDVVARYPEGDKSADALYRQGEALLKLGPNYAKAAGKAFERVVAEYPGSPRAAEARKQLELLATRG
ncbi:MAG: tol-pal system protein YbgF [Proteobacteria bacterium]|nr:MAG: tol-pal system protein YbgF [Pseudomonadota bacterium]